MNLKTLALYLIGRRDAIETVARSGWSVVIGLIFVISAGFAREYDGEDLWHEPWHVLRPLAASIASGTTLFLLVFGAAWLREPREAGDTAAPGFWQAYRSFMGLFWMTAPMAWLYAIPFERVLDPVEAVTANVVLLAVVAAWRVALMTRVVSVIYGIKAIPSFFFVMLFADAVVFAAVVVVGAPVIDVMGGVRHSDREMLLNGVKIVVMMLSLLTAPVWIIGAIVAFMSIRPRWLDLGRPASGGAPRALLAAACLSLFAFIPLLLVAQPEQMNRREVERLIEANKFAEAFATMSRRTPEDYPPGWDPPPRESEIWYGYLWPEMVAAMEASWPADWVARIYLAKLVEVFLIHVLPVDSDRRARVEWNTPHGEPDPGDEPGAWLTPQHRAAARLLLERFDGLTPQTREQLEELVRLAPEK